VSTVPGLNISTSGLNAADVEMQAISDNLANAATPGYIAQTPEVAALGGGANAVGSGVAITGISLDYSSVLSTLMNTTSSAASQASASYQVLSTAQSLFQEPSSTGLGSQLSTFWSDWSAVETNPGSSAAYDSLVGAAQQVTESLNNLAGGLTTTANGATSQLDNQVSEVNQQLSQLAQLNAQAVAAHGAESGQNGIAEQQQSLVSTIASEIGGDASVGPTGAVTYKVGGINLVQGDNSATVALSGGTLVLTGTTTAVPVSSGTVAGLMSAIGTVAGWQSSLDNVATTLASTVNTQLAAGVSWSPVGSSTATSSPGAPMFSFNGAPGAATIEVAPAMVADPTTVAAGSSTASGPLDGSNAAAVSALSDSPSGADALYQALVGNVGSAVQAAQASQSSTAMAASQAASTASAAEGVNQNNQLAAMLSDQQTYEACAKVITTAQSMVQSLLQAVS